MSLQNTYSDFVQFEIIGIEGSDTGPIPSGDIEFEYSNPSVGIDTGGNFVKHDIIGGPTVRQRVGAQPKQISISGVVKQDTAQQLELLQNASSATLISDRFAEGSVFVHVVSVTTDPLEDGGAADMTDGEFLYSFSMECVEIYSGGRDVTSSGRRSGL